MEVGLRTVVDQGKCYLERVGNMLEQICGKPEEQETYSKTRIRRSLFVRRSSELKRTAQLLSENRQALSQILNAFCADRA